MHRSGANLRSSDYQPNTLPMRHCYLVHNSNFKTIIQMFPLLVLLVASMLLPWCMMLLASMLLKVFLLLSALYTVPSVHALVFTHALAGTHLLACVSEVVGSSVAGVVAL